MLRVTLLICAILLSIGWIVGAGYVNMTGTAGRGGAIAVAVSFWFLFFDDRLATNIGKFLRQRGSPNAEIVERYVRASGTLAQNLYITASSVLGTLAWGFGDIAARHLPTQVLTYTGQGVSFVCQHIPAVCTVGRYLLKL